MKTTPKVLGIGIALAMVLWAEIASARIGDEMLDARIATALLGQAAPEAGAAEDPAQQTADLLRRARQAMAEGDLPAADALISRAEALRVPYGNFYMGDTPAKARRDLERRQGAAGAPGKSIGQLVQGSDKNKNAAAVDPFAGRAMNPAAFADSDQQVTPLPRVDGRPGTNSPYAAVQPGENDAQTPGSAPRGTNDSPLRKARLALAVGDVSYAGEMVSQARGTQVRYQPSDDTPEKVEAAIRKHRELSVQDKTTEAYARAYVRNMMEQADALARWGEYDEAERLAGRAASVRITYGPLEQKPQDMLERIAAARRQSSARTVAAASPASAGYANASAPPSAAAARQRVVEIVRSAREAIAAGQLDRAEALARQAEAMRLPDSAFAPGDDRPALVLMDLQQLRQRGAGAGTVVPAGGNVEADRNVARAAYDPERDPTRNVQASNRQPAYRTDPWVAQNQNPNADPNQYPSSPAPSPASRPETVATPQTPGMALFRQGEEALRARDGARALEFFRQAASYPNDLDPVTAQRLQDHLQMLSAPSRANPQRGVQTPTAVDDAAARQQVLIRQVQADLAHRESNARALRETDPRAALVMLEEARRKVEGSGIDGASRDQLLRRVDRAIAETQQVIERNKPQIELAEKNDRVRQEVERRQRMKVEVQEKLAMLIDDFNRLMDEQRYEEAGVVAKRASELAPNDRVVTQVLWQWKFVKRNMENKTIGDDVEEGFNTAMLNVDRAKVPFDGDKHPMAFANDGKDWKDLTARRKKYAGDKQRPRLEREVEIEKKLRTPVSLQFTNAPLSKVVDYLAKLTEINIHLDPQGLAEEGVPTDTPVSIDLRNEIMLKSALDLILQPLHLSYVVKDEVLKITSEQMRDGQVYTMTYNVADLVLPIPNFTPGPIGLQSAYHDALGTTGFGGGVPFGNSAAAPMTVAATRDGKQGGATINPNLLAQMTTPGTLPGAGGGVGKNAPSGSGPGGLGGGVDPDFDSLIELITKTVDPQSWEEVGGQGTIAQFDVNLCLIVRQTQKNHEEIADLLEQLRRMQDLQVTIEVRFITLNDNFYERIGVDFDFDINDNTDNSDLSFAARASSGTTSSPSGFSYRQGVNRYMADVDSNRTSVVGMSAPGVYSSDLDIPFTQGSYDLAVPSFGGYDAASGATLGFAILSDIEAYFFITAAQGDKRTNVLQAPKVTLFNGSRATVTDQTQSPFVISLIPVVGDFAAAQQPVIVVLSEGTFMSVQAVVTSDRRFVRLTIVPYFSSIGDVSTFTFSGTTTTTTDSTRSGLRSGATSTSKLWNNKSDSNTTTSSGTTVQLPSYSVVSVATTVSVPDGGTVLLGGIKRLSEGRNEYGTPLLNKLPYINRLFQNTSIGRETQSLMMMVTPRIIIQEEEEEKLGVTTP